MAPVATMKTSTNISPDVTNTKSAEVMIHVVQPDWQDIVTSKRAERDALIPKGWKLDRDTVQAYSKHPIDIFSSPLDPRVVPGIMSERELSLTSPSRDATALLDELRKGDISCEEMTRAFCKRAAIAHQLTNCLSEIMFDKAIERARLLDAIPRHDRKALHGLPITVKDSFYVTGYDSSIGITGLCHQPVQSDCEMVSILLEYGAVIIAKTNVPQTMLAADTDSIVFGRTCNAYKGNFAAAGSSGGEGAVIAMGGSSMGFGSDGAGSIRMPAFVNGIVGVRPSGYRFPLDGRPIFGKGVLGTTALGPVASAGPLTRSVRDAQLIYRLFSEARPWEKSPFLVPSPWMSVIAPDRLRIAVWNTYDHVHALPPVQRAFQEVQKQLTAAGHELVPFPGPSIKDLWKLHIDSTEIQDLRYLRTLLSAEPTTNIVKRMGIIYPPTPQRELSLDRLHDLNYQVAELVNAMHEAWNASGQPVDGLLWIPAPHPAVPFDEFTDLTLTALSNLIDWPAIVLPTGTVADHQIDSKYPPVPESDLYGQEDRRVQALYFGRENEYDGLPLSVQLIGRRGEDEKMLAVASKVYDVLQTPVSKV